MSLLSESQNDRVMAFIDLRNILKSANLGQNLRVDLYAVCKELVGSRRLVGAYVFDTRAPYGQEDPAHRMHDKLRFMGFRVIARESFDPNRMEQKEVDVALACEMVVHALKDNYDTALVVSGDRDFVPAIQHVQSAGKRVEVAAYSEAISPEMKRMCDRYRILDELPLLRLDTHVEEPKAEQVPEEAQEAA